MAQANPVNDRLQHLVDISLACNKINDFVIQAFPAATWILNSITLTKVEKINILGIKRGSLNPLTRRKACTLLRDLLFLINADILVNWRTLGYHHNPERGQLSRYSSYEGMQTAMTKLAVKMRTSILQFLNGQEPKGFIFTTPDTFYGTFHGGPLDGFDFHMSNYVSRSMIRATRFASFRHNLANLVLIVESQCALANFIQYAPVALGRCILCSVSISKNS